MEPVGEVLDHGRSPASRSHLNAIPATALIAVGLAIAAVAAGLTWWASRPPTSDRLNVVSATVVTQTRITVVTEPPIGGFATPAGASLPATTVRLVVGGDPSQSVEITTSPTYGAFYVEELPAATLAAGSFTEVDVTIAPLDCALALEGIDLDEAGYRWLQPQEGELLMTSSGADVPMSDEARATVGEAARRTCEGAGSAPRLTVTAARRGGEAPLETIGLIVDVAADADRLVLTPLDGPGLRGLGAADRRSGDRIPLLWLLAPGPQPTDEVTIAYTQVYVVRDGTAYPWVVGTPVTDDLPAMTPLTTSIR